MNNQNTIISTDNGYKLTNGNAQSIQTYDTYQDALTASQADIDAWDACETADRAEEMSPVTWGC